MARRPKTKTDMILAQLKAGHTVSKLTALHLNVGNIHDVIMRLRRRGHTIATTTHTDGVGRPYTKYVLVQEAA